MTGCRSPIVMLLGTEDDVVVDVDRVLAVAALLVPGRTRPSSVREVVVVGLGRSKKSHREVEKPVGQQWLLMIREYVSGQFDGDSWMSE